MTGAEGTQTAADTQLSIVVPVYNEEPNILPLAREVAAAMERVNMRYELVFIDDCSSDDTAARIAEASREFPQVRGLRANQRKGQSAAVWLGIQSTSSPLIATLDGDLQNDPQDLPRLLREVRSFDFVCGVRAKRRDNFIRRVSTRVARWARRKVLKVDFCDTGCAFRVFRRSAIEGIFPFDGLHRFLPVLVHATGVTTRQIPISHRARQAGRSKYGVWNRLWRGIYDLIAIAWWQKRRIGKMAFTEISSTTLESAASSKAAATERDEIRRRPSLPVLQPIPLR